MKLGDYKLFVTIVKIMMIMRMANMIMMIMRMMMIMNDCGDEEERVEDNIMMTRMMIVDAILFPGGKR